MAKKCTNSESDQRVNAVYDLLLRAHSRTQIIRFASETWGVGERQAEIYMSRARQVMALDAELERPQWLAAAVARLAAVGRAPLHDAFAGPNCCHPDLRSCAGLDGAIPRSGHLHVHQLTVS